MTIKQRYNLNKMIYTTKFVQIDNQTLLYYKAYIRIFNNWSDIVDGMNKDTLSCVYPTMKKLFTGSAGGGLSFDQLWTKQRLADGNMMNQRI